MSNARKKTIAILATDGVEEVELTGPAQALRNSGANVQMISLQSGSIQAMRQDVEPGDRIPVDQTVDSVTADQFDALVLPGGTTNPDKLRLDKRAVALVRAMVDAGKLVAAICHGPWTLIEADCVRGKRMTSWPSLQTDLRNAGAEWVDQACVVDGQLVTSRNPDDLPAFNRALLELIRG